ncbi:unnamed protein product [Closterium sp. Naga37s-1]|nr:unnamed protein product [Closterium sp. Naga37s-1]
MRVNSMLFTRNSIHVEHCEIVSRHLGHDWERLRDGSANRSLIDVALARRLGGIVEMAGFISLARSAMA